MFLFWPLALEVDCWVLNFLISLDVVLVSLPSDAKEIVGLTPLDEAFVGLLTLIRLAFGVALGVQAATGVQPALGPALECIFTLDKIPIVAYVKSEVAAFPVVATLVPATTFEVQVLATLDKATNFSRNIY